MGVPRTVCLKVRTALDKTIMRTNSDKSPLLKAVYSVHLSAMQCVYVCIHLYVHYEKHWVESYHRQIKGRQRESRDVNKSECVTDSIPSKVVSDLVSL